MSEGYPIELSVSLYDDVWLTTQDHHEIHLSSPASTAWKIITEHACTRVPPNKYTCYSFYSCMVTVKGKTVPLDPLLYLSAYLLALTQVVDACCSDTCNMVTFSSSCVCKSKQGYKLLQSPAELDLRIDDGLVKVGYIVYSLITFKQF